MQECNLKLAGMGGLMGISDEVPNMADQGAAILMSVGQTHMSVSTVPA